MKPEEKQNTRKKEDFLTRDRIDTGILIIFDTVDQKEPSGRMFNVHIPYGISFQGFGELFLKMERIYNLLGYPKEEFSMRNWKKMSWKNTSLESSVGWNFAEDNYKDFKEICAISSCWVYATTLFRQHGSWQGVMKAGKKDKIYYRSELELLRYIYQYLMEVK